MNIFEVLFFQPIFNLIVVLYRLLGSDLGLSIIFVGILSRTIMIPLTIKQRQMAESSKEFSEKSKEIKKKFKKNKEKQQEELMKLQKEYLPAQLGGCLPMILQFIIFINIYNVIRNLISDGASSFSEIAYKFVDKFAEGYTINTDFLSVLDLKSAPSEINDFKNVIPYLILVVLVGFTQYLSLKIMTNMRNDKEKESENKNKKKKGKDEPEDFGEIMQRSTKQAMYLMPILLMFISYNLPSGLSIYLITTGSFVILQQLIFSKYKEYKNNTD